MAEPTNAVTDQATEECQPRRQPQRPEGMLQPETCQVAFDLVAGRNLVHSSSEPHTDLTAAASLLSGEQVLVVTFLGEPGNRAELRLQVAISSAPPSGSVSDEANAFALPIDRASVALAFPGYELMPAIQGERPCYWDLPTPKHLMTLDHRLARQRGQRRVTGASQTASLTAEAPPQIAISPIGWAGPDVDTLLSSLSAAAQPFAVTVRIRHFEIGLGDRMALGLAIRQFQPDLNMLMEDPLEARRLFTYRSLIERWFIASGGWKVQFSLALPTAGPEIEAVLQAAVSHLFGSAANRDCEVEDHVGVLDLSCAFPVDGRLPKLMPSHEALQRLGLAGVANVPRNRGRQAPQVESLTVGLDAVGRPARIPRADLQRHMLLEGGSGTGKSTLMKQMIAQDIAAGYQIFCLEPHGPLHNAIKGKLPKDGPHAPIDFDLSQGMPAYGLDLLNPIGPDKARSANLAANELARVFKKVLHDDNSEPFGPIWTSYWRNSVLLLQLSEGNWTLADLDRVFHDSAFRRSLLQTCSDPIVVRFWTGIALKAGGEAALENLGPYIVSKLNELTSPTVRPIIDGSLPKLDLISAFDQGRPVIINLAKGAVGASDALLVGALVTAELMRVLMARCSVPGSERRPVRIYLDEFQTYATDTLAQLMAEGRKTGAEMVLASQDLTSFGGSRYQPRVADAILSNVGNLISFRTGPRDAALLSDWFSPTFTSHDLTRLPDRTFAARLMHGGVPMEPSLVRTLDE